MRKVLCTACLHFAEHDSELFKVLDLEFAAVMTGKGTWKCYKDVSEGLKAQGYEFMSYHDVIFIVAFRQ